MSNSYDTNIYTPVAHFDNSYLFSDTKADKFVMTVKITKKPK
jgi:hypothetical protein